MAQFCFAKNGSTAMRHFLFFPCVDFSTFCNSEEKYLYRPGLETCWQLVSVGLGPIQFCKNQFKPQKLVNVFFPCVDFLTLCNSMEACWPYSVLQKKSKPKSVKHGSMLAATELCLSAGLGPLLLCQHKPTTGAAW